MFCVFLISDAASQMKINNAWKRQRGNVWEKNKMLWWLLMMGKSLSVFV
jgi:hypothetical protein